MAQVRVHNFSVSLDGFGTGEGQSLDAPFGHASADGVAFATRTSTRCTTTRAETRGSMKPSQVTGGRARARH